MTKSTIPNDQRIGICENTDPCFHLEIFDNLYRGNIIVTKRLTDKMIEKLVENKGKCILHLTCTNLGDKLEPFVPTLEQTYNKFKKLVGDGFPVEQVVLRIDPIIPTERGANTAFEVIRKFFPVSEIKRVRISFMDNYKHVIERFTEKGWEMPYQTFHAPLNIRLNVLKEFQGMANQYGFDLEVCGEPGIPSIPCLSQKDIDILGLTEEIKLEGKKEQRGSCGCPANKFQLYKGKPEHCKNGCLYCYWKD